MINKEPIGRVERDRRGRKEMDRLDWKVCEENLAEIISDSWKNFVEALIFIKYYEVLYKKHILNVRKGMGGERKGGGYQTSDFRTYAILSKKHPTYFNFMTSR